MCPLLLSYCSVHYVHYGVQHLTKSIPIGVLPLGKENWFYQSCGSARSSFNTPARYGKLIYSDQILICLYVAMVTGV